MLKRNGIQKGERVKMLKILVSLGILLFTFGCDGSMIYKPDLEEEFDEISVVLNPRLQQDVNGYFHLQLNKEKWQTLHRIEGLAFTSDTTAYVPNLRVEWESSHYWYMGDTLGYFVRRTINSDGQYGSLDTSYAIGFEGHEVPTTNQVSYSNGYGEINNMIAPVQTMVGDTMYIWATYFEWAFTDWKTIEIPIVLD